MANEKSIIDPSTNKPAKAAAQDAAGAVHATAHQATAVANDTAEALANAASETLRATQDNARRAFEQAAGAAKQALGQNGGKMFQGFDQFNAFGKDNVDAVMKSSQLMAKGAEDIGRQMMSFAQQAIEMNVNAGRALMGIKSLKDSAEMQNQYSRTSFDALVQESTKLSELAMKTTTEALEPINSRATAMFEQLSRPQAA